MAEHNSGADNTPHHPLPASEKARHDEIPETIEREKDLGDDDGTERGKRASKKNGAVTESGAGAGGGGGPEDYDQDPQAGGGKLNQAHGPRPARGADAPVAGSR